MNTQEIAQHLNLAKELILEVQEWACVLWVRIKGMRPKFVSKKIAKKMDMIQVEVSKETVVVDLKSGAAYVVRSGYDLGDFYLIKKFDPKGKDIRMMDFSTTKGEQLPDRPTSSERSEEYNAVIAAISYSKPKLVAYGMPGQCRYPNGYKQEKAGY